MSRFECIRGSTAVLAVVLAATRPVMSFGYEDALGIGTDLPGISPSTLALGGMRAVSYGEPACVMLNPAYLCRYSTAGLSVSIGPGIAKEQLDDSTGRHTRDYIALGQLGAASRVPLGSSFAAGAGIARITDQTYDGLHYIADDPVLPGKITGLETYSSSGGLWEAVGGLSWRARRWLLIGASAGPRFGSGTGEYEYDDWEGEDDSTYTVTWEESSIAVHAGVFVPFDLNSIGVSWASGSERYPARVAVGALLFSGSGLKGSFGGEVEIVDPGEEQTITGRLMGAVSPSRQLELRGSFFFSDRGGSAESRSRLGLSFGMGLTLGRAVLEAAFSSSSYKRETTAFGFEGFEDITDRLSIFAIGLALTL